MFDGGKTNSEQTGTFDVNLPIAYPTRYKTSITSSQRNSTCLAVYNIPKTKTVIGWYTHSNSANNTLKGHLITIGY